MCVCVCVCVCMQSCFSHVWLFATLWTVARQASLSLGFSRQEYWSGLSCPPPENLPNPGVDHVSFVSPAVAGRFFTTNATWEAPYTYIFFFIFFSIVVYYRILHTVLCAMQLLSVHSIYNSLHMLIPNSLSNASPLSITFYLQDVTITYQVFLPACLPDSSAGIPYHPNL